MWERACSRRSRLGSGSIKHRPRLFQIFTQRFVFRINPKLSERRHAQWINPRKRLGVEVARSGVDAQLHVAGVSRVELVGWQDLAPTKAQAAYCTGYTVTLAA